MYVVWYSFWFSSIRAFNCSEGASEYALAKIEINDR